VDVVGNVISPVLAGPYLADVHTDYARLRASFLGRGAAPTVPYDEARGRKPRLSWTSEDINRPGFLGARTVATIGLDELVPYVDWTPFFHTWELKGVYPRILEHPEHGAAARELFENAQALLAKIVDKRLLHAFGVYGFFPANADGDDVILWQDETRKAERSDCTSCGSRSPRPTASRSSRWPTSWPRATAGSSTTSAAAVTTGIGATLAKKYEADHDDYNAIPRALADRLSLRRAAPSGPYRRGYGRDERPSSTT
jgi:5-methyltetrahydrofolate--homocysteine methyltransferase